MNRSLHLKKVFRRGYLSIVTKLILASILTFSTLFYLEGENQKKTYFSGLENELNGILKHHLQDMNNMMGWVYRYNNFARADDYFKEPGKATVYIKENIREWMKGDRNISSVLILGPNGEKLLGTSRKKIFEKESLRYIKNNLLNDRTINDHVMVSHPMYGLGDYFYLHLVPFVGVEGVIGYFAVTIDFKPFLDYYNYDIYGNLRDLQLGIAKINNDGYLEGLVRRQSSDEIKLYRDRVRYRGRYLLNQEGNHVIFSENFRKGMGDVSLFRDKNISFYKNEDLGEAYERSAFFIIVGERILNNIYVELFNKYILYMLCIVLVTMIISYYYYKVSFQAKVNEKKLKKKQRELERHMKARDAIVSIVAHDIKGPFTSLLGLVSMANRNIDRYSKEQLASYAKLIESDCQRVCTLSENLLRWANIQSKVYSFTPKNYQIRSIVMSILQEVKSSMEVKQIEREVDIDVELVSSVDREMLKAILRNILINSIKYTPKDGTIYLSGKKDGDKVILSIRDTGFGMTEETKDKLLNGDLLSTLGSDGERGNGVGIFLVKKLCKINGGSLSFTSEEGEGTTFFIELLGKKQGDNTSYKEEEQDQLADQMAKKKLERIEIGI